LHRKRLRLIGFDYATGGAYVVTACARERRCLFGDVDNDAMRLGTIGRIVADALEGMGTFHDGVYLDARVVMPNHVHAILVLDHPRHRPPPVPAVVGAFKARASRRAGMMLWQRGFHDRIIRSEQELTAFRQYIAENPLRWALDRENPARLRRPSDRAG
jgi:REP element-mobilizing transposase RayT